MSRGTKPSTEYQSNVASLKRPALHIPRGPYKTKAERWGAFDKFLDFQALRAKYNMPQTSQATVEKITGISWDEMQSEINSQAFQGMRVARATIKIQGALVEAAPTMMRLLADMEAAIQGDKHVCEACSEKLKVIPLKLEDKKKYLDTIQTMMDRVGFSKVDLSSADVMNDLNTDEAIEEGMKIVEDLTGDKTVIQRFIVACTDPGTLRANKGQVLAPRISPTTPENDKEVGPVPAVQAVRLHEAPADEHEEVPVRNNVEPIIENELDML